MPLRSKLIIYAVVMLLLFSGLTVGGYLSLSAASRDAEEARADLAKLSLLETVAHECAGLGPSPDRSACLRAREALSSLSQHEWSPEARLQLDRIQSLAATLAESPDTEDSESLNGAVRALRAFTLASVRENLRSAGRPAHRRAIRLLVAACLAALGGSAMFAWFYNRIVGDRKALTDRLLRSEKLGAIGTLAAGIAHEINNPLATISMSAEALSERLPRDFREVGYCQAIQEEAGRCRDIIGDLSDLTRGGAIDREPVDPEELATEAVRVVSRNTNLPQVVIQARVNEGLPLVSADRGKLLQVLVNLLTNAIEATGEGGRVAVAARRAGDHLAFAVEDDGRGIPSHLLGRIFEPFFTMSDRGIGLGLTLCHRIAELHGGDLTAHSAGPGRGSTFTLSIPIEAGPDAS